MPAYTGKATSGILFDFTVAVSNSDNVELTLNPGASATMLDIQRLENELLKLRAQVDETVEAHNANEASHPPLQAKLESLEDELAQARIQMAQYGARLDRLESMIVYDITGNSFLTAFDTLDGLVVEGVWNKAQQRMEF